MSDMLRRIRRERAGDIRLAPWLRDFTQDLHFAARLLVKERGFTMLAVVALGLGIGVNHTMFSIVNAFCIRGLPIDRPDRVVFISTRDGAGRSSAVSFPEFEEIRGSVRSVRDPAAYVVAPVALRDEGRAADRLVAAYISSSTFRTIGSAPIRGRAFRESDDTPGAAPVAIIAGSVWHGRYGAAEDVIGRSVIVNGAASTVIGVMPDRFGFPNNTEIWLPLAAWPGLARAARDARALAIIGRLRDDATLLQARAELEATGQRWSIAYPATNERRRVETVPINERFLASITHPAWLAFLTAGIVVVLIACANVANLLLSRALARTREIAIRASIGASRLRIVRQLLTESALLAVLGGIMGYALSILGLRVMEAAIPASARAYWLDFSMDGRAFAVLAAVCLGAAVVFGLVPALHVSNTNALAVLHDGERGATPGFRARRWTTVFLTAEFALTMILLSGVGGTVTGFIERQRVDSVIDPEPLLTMMVSLSAEKYPTPARRIVFFETLSERLRSVGPIAGFALASALPLAGAPARDIEIDGRTASPERTPLSVRTVTVSEGYFDAVGLRPISGRAFGSLDGTPGHATVVVNERFATMHFPNTSPLGKRIRLKTANTAAPPDGWLHIVGVSPTVRQRPDLEPDAVVYLPYRSDPPPTAALIVRSLADRGAIGPRVREEFRALDPDLPIYRMLPLAQAMSEAMWNTRVSAWIITVIALISSGLSIVGLYAVTVHAVSQRRQEMGIRVAVGAEPRDVRWLVLRRAMWQIAAGLAAGIAGVYAWDKVFSLGHWSEPVGVAVVATGLACVAIAACLVPANRTARLDPMVALRTD